MDNDSPNNQPQQPTPSSAKRVIQPLPTQASTQSTDENLAAEVIRQKIQNLYSTEPDAKEEIAEAEAAIKPRSKHQEYMYQLSTSGKALAEIQTAWHNYYTNLPDTEKHEVWQEFYSNHARTSSFARVARSARPQPVQSATPVPEEPVVTQPQPVRYSSRTTSEIKGQLLNKINAGGKLKARHHFQSLLFGVGLASFMSLIMLFGLFNERIIAPFITPSRVVSATPIIIDPNDTQAASQEPKIIIPKINVEIPVVYDEPSIQEDAVQKALERGVVHYATTPNPGERGNAVIFGHSSNNILNEGKYKFAFVLLHRLEIDDTFILDYEGKRYVYRVFEKKIVEPTEVSVLKPTDRPATVTLITCDPPGTALRRLVVVAEQISPDPSANTASTAADGGAPDSLPSDSPSLFRRILDSF